MKRIYHKHPKIINSFTTIFFLLGIIGAIGSKATVFNFLIGTIFFVVIGLILGYLISAALEIFHLLFSKTKKQVVPKVLLDSENIVPTDDINISNKSSDDYDIIDYKVFNLLDKPHRCSNCQQTTLIFSRVKFNDGYLCEKCLANLKLKKSLDLDLWAQHTPWKNANTYKKE